MGLITVSCGAITLSCLNCSQAFLQTLKISQWFGPDAHVSMAPPLQLPAVDLGCCRRLRDGSAVMQNPVRRSEASTFRDGDGGVQSLHQPAVEHLCHLRRFPRGVHRAREGVGWPVAHDRAKIKKLMN
ncbi:MAG: hypothetical protein AAGD34_13895, partial [Pseudomonadota bacterium]